MTLLFWFFLYLFSMYLFICLFPEGNVSWSLKGERQRKTSRSPKEEEESSTIQEGGRTVLSSQRTRETDGRGWEKQSHPKYRNDKRVVLVEMKRKKNRNISPQRSMEKVASSNRDRGRNAVPQKKRKQSTITPRWKGESSTSPKEGDDLWWLMSLLLCRDPLDVSFLHNRMYCRRSRFGLSCSESLCLDFSD